MFAAWYYPIAFRPAAAASSDSFLVFLFLAVFMLWSSTFSHLAVAAAGTAELAAVPAALVWMLCMAFCGVGVARADLPPFWAWMYRLSPATYLVAGVLAACMHGQEVVCDGAREVLRMAAPEGVGCADFLRGYAEAAGGKVLQDAPDGGCRYCPVRSADEFLAGFDVRYDERWRNFGLLWVYVLVNVVGALGLYWAFRVPKGRKGRGGSGNQIDGHAGK